jgi:hypothetical protein
MRLVLFRLIGILEIAGGFYGIVAALRRLLPLGSTHESIFALIDLAVFAFVLVAGVLLLDNSERGITFSRWAQLLQIPLIATSVFSYALSSGAFVDVYSTLHMPPHLVLDWRFATEAFVLATSGPGAPRVGINLLALLSWLALRFR